MPATSNASTFYQSILGANNPIEHIRDFYRGPTPVFETEFFDCKQVPMKGANTDDDKVKELWFTALSGFSNVQGGVIVWGLDARRTPGDDFDRVCGEVLIDNPNGFKSLLISYHLNATNPPVQGVEIEALADPSGKGFVVCLIPESAFRPHRAEIPKGKRQYFIRSQDNFVVAPPALLRVLFYPRLHAHFEITCNLRYVLGRADRGDSEFNWWLNAIIANRGNASAEKTRITYALTNIDPAVENYQSVPAVEMRTVTDIHIFDTIHPGFSTPFLSCTWRTQATGFHDRRYSELMGLTIPAIKSLPKLIFNVYASNQQPQRIEVDFVDTEPLRQTYSKSRTVVAELL